VLNPANKTLESLDESNTVVCEVTLLGV